MNDSPEAEYVREEGGFSVHARYSDPEFVPKYHAGIYLGVTMVFDYSAKASDFPTGIEDFAGYAFRKFAERLQYLLRP